MRDMTPKEKDESEARMWTAIEKGTYFMTSGEILAEIIKHKSRILDLERELETRTGGMK